MEQKLLIDKINQADESKKNLGNGLFLKINEGNKFRAILYRHDTVLKIIDFSDKAAKRLLVVELVELGAKPSYIADVLNISRQTIHNYIESNKYFGLEGLIHNYKPSKSKNRKKQRKIHLNGQFEGNKSKQLAEIRKNELEEREQKQRRLKFSFQENNNAQKPDACDQPFSEEHDWIATRYAGVFTYFFALISEWKWLDLVIGHFGSAYKIFMVFILMVSRNIRSIEQLKNVQLREAGAVLGLVKLFAKPKTWEWFYDAAHKRISDLLLKDYFGYQIRAGLVGCWLWFTDGHLLPYTGREKVRYAFNTQRRMPEPGRTNLVTCDESGRVVDFEIQEGKGDLRGYIIALKDKWESEISEIPVMVFDREGSGTGFFASLVRGKTPFVTWEKNADTEKLKALGDERFTKEFEFNGKSYSVFEDEKFFSHKLEDERQDGNNNTYDFKLRRIYIWNKTSKRRACGLAWDGDKKMSTEECAKAILCRWGASENTFKHINDRHPLHYHPGFKLSESEHQEIDNPAVKKVEGAIKRVKNTLSKLYEKYAKTSDAVNKDGKPRQNSIKERLNAKIEEQKTELEEQKEAKNQLPKKVDVSLLEDYKSFNQIDNEGKNLFDFVTCSVWNARKQMVDWLRPFFNGENELVDLFYAITNCHGWIKSTKKEVIVRLEPLQQPKRRLAQEQLCRKLSNLGVKTPNGKWMLIEVGEAPN